MSKENCYPRQKGGYWTKQRDCVINEPWKREVYHQQRKLAFETSLPHKRQPLNSSDFWKIINTLPHPPKTL